jgi:hypothetical protein
MHRRTALLALAGICLFILGCPKVDKRINAANFAKIKPGMSWEEVSEILGPGGQEIEGMSGMGSGAAAVGVVGGLDSVSSKPAMKTYRWGNEYTNITIVFNRSDKVQDGKDCITSKGLK